MGDHYRITDLADSDRPRERLARLGAAALSNAELIAILLRSGIPGKNALQLAREVLVELGGLAGIHRASYDQLKRMRGLGDAKAAQIKAAVEVGRRLAAALPEDRPVVQSPEDAASLVMFEMGALEREHLRVIVLDTRNHVMRVCEVYKGSLNSSVVRINEVFRDAVRMNGAAVIVAHNHPSGDPTPSAEDISITKAIIAAGRLLDIEVLDHIIIGKGRFVSMKARRLGFEV